jgi:tetratricopeptide (TPR) repeat protein
MKHTTRALLGVVIVALAGSLTLAPAFASPPLRQAEGDAGAGADTPAAEKQSKQNVSAKAQEYYRQGVELMNSSRFLDAVERFQLALDEEPDYVEAHQRLAFVYTKMGQTEPDYYQDALDVYEELKEMLPPDDVEVRKNIAFVQYAMGDVDDAVATYEDILKITPEDCGIWTQIGAAQKVEVDRMKRDGNTDDPEYQQRLDKAIGAYRKVIELCPDDLEAAKTLAEIYFFSDQQDKAAVIYTQMLEKDPENMDTLSKLAYIYKGAAEEATKRKDNTEATAFWKKAIPVYEKILEVDPSKINERKQYAIALQKSGQLIKAAEQLKRLIDEDPDGASLYCNLCMLYAMDAEDADQAIDTAMRGIAANAPNTACLTYGWGKGLELRATGLLKKGDYDRAISTYREAKLKFSTILNDPNFGKFATQQLDRMDKFIKIGEQTREKNKQQGR